MYTCSNELIHAHCDMISLTILCIRLLFLLHVQDVCKILR